ncbi:hypothetical protein [Novosphingobium sp. BL-8A]
MMLAANASLPPPAAKVADHAVEWRGPTKLWILCLVSFETRGRPYIAFR